jgi:hypothetical protein
MAWFVNTSRRCPNSSAKFSTVGDIAYADAWVNEEKEGYVKPLNLTDGGAEYDKILNDFYNEVEPLSEIRPYMVAVGKFSR